MKNTVFAGLSAMIIPFSATAQELPLYIETDGELSFSGDMLSEAQVTEMLGGPQGSETFGRPEFIAQDVRTGVTRVSYATPSEYELVKKADGIIENQHDDLNFSEEEGLDIRDDLEFNADEGTDIRDDITFSEDEALAVSQGFDGPSGFYTGSGQEFIQPEHGDWGIQLDSTEINGCPPGVGELAMTQLTTSTAVNVIFSEPGWVPADLNPDYARYGWAPVGTNGYFAAPFSTGAEALGSGMSLSVTMGLAAKSETQIKVWARVLLNLTPMLATMSGGSETCTAVVTGTYRKN